jgi:hypothetical protein
MDLDEIYESLILEKGQSKEECVTEVKIAFDRLRNRLLKLSYLYRQEQEPLFADHIDGLNEKIGDHLEIYEKMIMSYINTVHTKKL